MISEKVRIIVCDDEEPMRELLEELLTDESYAVTTASNGAELRRLLPQIRPDLVSCDLKMPGEDGLSLTRWLRAESHAAVLMLTGMGSVLDRVVGLEMGADDYLGNRSNPPNCAAGSRPSCAAPWPRSMPMAARRTASAAGAAWSMSMSMSSRRRCSTMPVTRSP